MKLDTAKWILNEYNLWRTGKIDFLELTPKEITEAIDTILKYLNQTP